MRTFFWILLLNVVLRFPTLYTPILDIDESQYGHFASKLLDDSLPYKDVVGEKMPFSYYYYYWIFTLFGDANYFAVHCVTIVVVSCTAWALFGVAACLKKNVASLAAVFYCVFTTTHEPKMIATSGEVLMNLPLVCAALLFFYSRKIPRAKYVLLLLWCAGLLCGAAFLFRQQAALNMLALAVCVCVLSGRKLSQCVKELCAFCFGCLVPVLGVVWWAYAMDVLKEFYFWTWEFNMRYVRLGSRNTDYWLGALRLTAFVLFTLPLWVFASRTVRVYLSKRFYGEQRQLFVVCLLVWFVCSLYPVFLGARFYSHYFIQCLPALCLLGAFGYAEGLGYQGSVSLWRWVRPRFLWVLIVYAVVPLTLRVRPDMTHALLARVSPGSARLNVYPEQEVVARYVQSKTQRSDYVFVWGFATPIYVHAERLCGSRFLWADFLSGRTPGKALWQDHPDTSQYIVQHAWKDFCHDMNRYQPLYFIDTSTGAYHEYKNYPLHKQYSKFSLGDFIQDFYTKETTLADMDIYRRTKTIRLHCNF